MNSITKNIDANITSIRLAYSNIMRMIVRTIVLLITAVNLREHVTNYLLSIYII